MTGLLMLLKSCLPKAVKDCRQMRWMESDLGQVRDGLQLQRLEDVEQRPHNLNADVWCQADITLTISTHLLHGILARRHNED